MQSRHILRDLFTRFGYYLGISAQIANDMEGITGGRDIGQRKITLPFVYALSNAAQTEKDLLKRLLTNKNDLDESTRNQVKEILFHSGAMHYATLTLETYRQLALNILAELKQAGVDTRKLVTGLCF